MQLSFLMYLTSVRLLNADSDICLSPDFIDLGCIAVGVQIFHTHSPIALITHKYQAYAFATDIQLEFFNASIII